MNEPRYPDIQVQLIGTDGNALAILSKVKRHLHAHGVSENEIGEFMEEATGGDYDHLLATVMNWVEVT